MANLEQIKKIREMLGSGIVETKNALDEADGDEEKAIEIIRKKGQLKAAKKSDREAGEGVVVSYIHPNNKLGAIVKLYCESDFVARNTEFLELAKDLAMHVSAMNPQYVKPEDVPTETLEKEKDIWQEQLKAENKPVEIMAKILEGKEKKFREDLALLTQPFVKNPDQTIEALITEKIAKIGENIRVGGFTRMEL
ncbi:MAG: translation elongation factor Ts [Parcubacteria group bacterium]|jgi:elongation factor Ts